MYIYGTITETFVEFYNRDLNKPIVYIYLKGNEAKNNFFGHQILLKIKKTYFLIQNVLANKKKMLVKNNYEICPKSSNLLGTTFLFVFV